MHDAELSKISYRLDWDRVEQIIREFFNPEEQTILNSFFGLNDHDKLAIRQIAKQQKMKIKPLSEKIAKLEKQLYKILKAENLDQLIQEQLEQLSLSEEISHLTD
ncbi:MAG: hypothetical protein GX978_02530 [Tissierellia bacterium]|jgi:hypothetical protein|nr:hypothetical protein [Tissierellia bacterium]